MSLTLIGVLTSYPAAAYWCRHVVAHIKAHLSVWTARGKLSTCQFARARTWMHLLNLLLAPDHCRLLQKKHHQLGFRGKQLQP